MKTIKRTISAMSGKGVVDHNRRTYTAENVDPSRTHLNIEYCYTPIEQAYHNLFDEALAEFNAKQKRKDRCIENYYEKICKGKQEKPFYEVIFQIGNKDDMAAASENGELARKVLDKFMRTFQERNPQLHVFSAHLHMDEATPHLHIDFDIGAIEIDKSSEGYRQLMSVTKDIAGATAKAEAEAKIKDIADKQRIEAENYEETLRIQREEGQYTQHMHTRTANFGAYQVEKQAEVGVAGAEALGQMGANGVGDVNIGGGGDGMGFNMAAMMASMAVGGAVGQNIAGAMNNMMGGINQQTAPGAVPPPIPVVAYHVAINGQAAGPFDLSVLTQMVTAGQFTADSLVWKNGMAQWAKAGTVDELKGLFTNTMPPIPPVV